MKLFELRETGISGTGVVAQGIIFDNGKIAITWLTAHTSCTVYESIDDVIAIHGNHGKTRVVQIADINMEGVRHKCMNSVQDELEGVYGCMLHAGGNQKYMVEQRNWFVNLFIEKELASEIGGAQ